MSFFDKLGRHDSSGSAVMVSDEICDEFQREILSLHPRKRSKYKSHLTDKWGQRSRVVFRGGKFMNYSLKEKRFVPIVRVSEARRHDPEPSSVVGQLVADDFDVDNAVLATMIATHTGHHAGRLNNRTAIPTPVSNR